MDLEFAIEELEIVHGKLRGSQRVGSNNQDLSDLSNQNGGYKRNTHDSSELSRLGTRSSRTYTRYMFCTGGKMICSVIWVKQ